MESLIGYRTNVWALVPLTLLTLISGGTVWIAAQHDCPRVVTWALTESSLQEAHYVLAKVRQRDASLHQALLVALCLLKPHVVVPARQQASYDKQGPPSQLVCKKGVYPSQSNRCVRTTCEVLHILTFQQPNSLHFIWHKINMCDLITFWSSLQEHDASSTSEAKVFRLLLDTYIYTAPLGTFVPMPSMPAQLPAQLCSAARALQAIDQGKSQLKILVCGWSCVALVSFCMKACVAYSNISLPVTCLKRIQ